MDDPQLLLEIGRMDDQEIVKAITQLRQERDRLRAALTLCADTLEGHLDEPQAVTHAECRMAARQARAVLDGGKPK